MSRRSFFKVSSIAGGGMLFGFTYLVSCSRPQEIAEEALEMPEEWFELNGYCRIGDNGVVTIISPNPEIGQNVKTSMPMIVAEELDVPWKNVVVEQGMLDTDVFDNQFAGGSQSIRLSWNNLRQAGATARQMLVMAAAQQWGVDAGQCTTRAGVIYGPDEKSIGYGEVASLAATLEVPEEVQLKDPADFTIIGQPTRNVEIEKIITGKPLFGLDTQREGMRYAVMLRPPAFGQKLVRFDDSAARAVAGVHDVRQFGNKIAVLATHTWAAIKGQRALRAEWTADTPPENTTGHDDQLRQLLSSTEGEVLRNDGDVEQAFREADEVMERVYESPFLPHNCLEPMNFFAHVTEEKAELHGPVQTPAGLRRRAAEFLGREEGQVTVSMTRMGGGFGRRLYHDYAMEALEIAAAVGTPVQLVFTREDDMAAGTYRPAIKYKIEASIKDGAITGYRLTEAAINRGMYGLVPHFFPAGAFPNYQVRSHALESNVTIGAWRAPYTNFLAFAEQSFFNELADKLELDPVQMRLDLLEGAKSMAESDDNIAYSPARMQDCIRLVTEKAGWGNAPSGVYQGISAYYSHQTHVAEIAEVVLENGAPVVKKVYCAVDCGIVVNPEGARNQIEGGIIDGIGHAMYGDFSISDGRPSASNFDKFRLIRQQEAPEVEIHFVKNTIDPTGLGEPALPPAAGAVAHAIFRATGKRMYKQPFVQEEAMLG